MKASEKESKGAGGTSSGESQGGQDPKGEEGCGVRLTNERTPLRLIHAFALKTLEVAAGGTCVCTALRLAAVSTRRL